MQVLPKPLTNIIDEFSSLPGIGPRSAARIAYYLTRIPEERIKSFGEKLIKLSDEIVLCKECFNYTDKEKCIICASVSRLDEKILVVEEPLDVVAIERMGTYRGKYHVLGGVLSPANGIGPDDIRLKELINRVREDLKEIILATNPNLEGESTAIYIKKELEKKGYSNKITRIARGIPSGADLEYADELTLQRAIDGRIDY